ncbi:MAG TPA: hypothetical protein VH593_29090 [Ktedonobacteraceae bacterium]
MTDTDRILLNTEWIKVAAKHHGQKGVIDNLGPRGPRMRLIDGPIGARHGSRKGGQPRYQRLDWWELGNNWEPLNRPDYHQYDLWRAAKDVERYAAEKERLNSMIEKDNTIMTPELPQAFVECHSVYHHGDKQTPQDQAYMTRNGFWWCLVCKGKREEYGRNQAARMRAAKAAKKEAKQTTAIEYVPPKMEIEPVEVLPEWRVTIVEPTVHVVRARDFLEAATLVSEKGEIVKVEKL